MRRFYASWRENWKSVQLQGAFLLQKKKKIRLRFTEPVQINALQKKRSFAFLYRKDIELLGKPTFDLSPVDSARRDRKMSVCVCVCVCVCVHFLMLNLSAHVSQRWLNGFGRA